MRQVVWTRQSRSDLAEILLFIAQRNPAGAKQPALAIKKTLKLLADFPGAGRDRSELAAALRSFPVSHYGNYLIFYRVTPQRIELIRLLHGSRHLPKLFDPSPGP